MYKSVLPSLRSDEKKFPQNCCLVNLSILNALVNDYIATFEVSVCRKSFKLLNEKFYFFIIINFNISENFKKQSFTTFHIYFYIST